MVKLFVTPPAFAVSVADFEELTVATLAVKLALAAFADTVTLDGTVTAELVLPSVTLTPPLGADPFNVMVHLSEPAPVTEEFVQERPVKIPEGFKSSTALCVVPFPFAEMVAVCELLTAATVAEKLALVAPASTVTLEGTETEALLLDNATWKPPLEAAAVRSTVQLTFPEPVIVPVLQVRELGETVTPDPDVVAFFPVPLRETVALGVDFELFVIVRVPDVDVACFGL